MKLLMTSVELSSRAPSALSTACVKVEPRFEKVRNEEINNRNEMDVTIDSERVHLELFQLCLNFTLSAADFKDVLEEFDEVIKNASFFSIDSEFTGMNNERSCPYSTPAELYKQICAVTDEYIIVQLGITAFRVSPGN